MSVHSDEEAMIAAVEADRFDDAPMLVYADWLQEHCEELKSEYVRLVVKSSRSLETREDRDRIFELAAALPADWRNRVGSRFEIVAEGNPAILLVAHLFNAVLNLAIGEAMQRFERGKPVLLKTYVTREEGEEFASSFGPNPLGESENTELADRIRFYVRPMEGPSFGLFASKN